MRYSQYEEQLIIDEFFGQDFIGTFLDIGAADGDRNSNTRLLAKKGWSGWLVEPLPSSFIELQKLYAEEAHMTLVNAALSANGRPVKFFTGKEPQLSTASQETAGLMHMRPWLTRKFWIPTITPNDLLEMMGGAQIDFVSLDCEGLDLEIARGCQELFKDVKLLCYESDMPGQSSNPAYDAAWQEVLTQLGFTRQVGKTKGNTLVARS
jgi:FkbM family methyltransferase